MSNYKPDFYAQKAKKDGYSARSVYKLEEIHRKYLKTLHNAKNILDLGAAPGSWSQYLQTHLSNTTEITAVDLQELDARFALTPKINFIQGNFTEFNMMEEIIALKPFDFILSDAAPQTSGNKNVDTARSEQLVECITHIAQQALTADGIMVAKLFQGSGTMTLLQQLRSTFSKVVCVRPKAVKPSSFETYLVCSKLL